MYIVLDSMEKRDKKDISTEANIRSLSEKTK